MTVVIPPLIITREQSVAIIEIVKEIITATHHRPHGWSAIHLGDFPRGQGCSPG